MEEHEVKMITMKEKNVFKSVPVGYDAQYHYCPQADEAYADEQQMSANDIAIKNAYREMIGLLTSYQISAIRAIYGISQSDLCILLGWGQGRNRYQKFLMKNTLKLEPSCLNKFTTGTSKVLSWPNTHVFFTIRRQMVKENVVADMIRYFANSAQVTSLYHVKLIEFLWYGDALSYQRHGHAISGMVF